MRTLTIILIGEMFVFLLAAEVQARPLHLSHESFVSFGNCLFIPRLCNKVFLLFINVPELFTNLCRSHSLSSFFCYFAKCMKYCHTVQPG